MIEGRDAFPGAAAPPRLREGRPASTRSRGHSRIPRSFWRFGIGAGGSASVPAKKIVSSLLQIAQQPSPPLGLRKARRRPGHSRRRRAHLFSRRQARVFVAMALAVLALLFQLFDGARL